MKKTVLNNNRGLTLIELMVGIVILSIVVVPLLHMFITSADTVRKTDIYQDATALAQDQLENIEAEDITDFISDNSKVYDSSTQTYTFKNIDGSPYDVVVKLNENTTANTTKVAVDNPMDAIIDMNSADQNALNTLNGELTELTGVAPSPALGNLKRTITITSTKVTDGYTLNVLFRYTGSFSGIDKNENSIPVNFDYNVESSADVKTANSFSLYMFFQAFYSGKDTIIITNPDYSNSDFKVFLVNTNSSTPAIGYKTDIRYFYQTDKNKNLVFTNIPISSYKAFYTDSTWFQAIPAADASLVELKKLDRMYTANVKVYKHSDYKHSDSEPTLAEMSSEKLN